MSTQRILKQATYAGGCVLFVVVAGIIIVLLFQPKRSPGPIMQATPTSLLAIIVEEVSVVDHGRSVDVVARLRNPNQQSGVAFLPVTFNITDASGQTITEEVVNSYILPGSLQYVVALEISVDTAVGDATAKIPLQPDYTGFPPSLTLPSLGTFLRSRATRLIGDQSIEEQKGVAENDSNFDFQHVSITAIALNAAGGVTGVGTTFVGELKASEQREFTVQWPQPTIPTTRVLTFANTNIFNEEAIIRVIGDPNKLR